MSNLMVYVLGLGSGCWDLIDSICKPIATMLFTAIDTVDSVFRRLAGIKSTADANAGVTDFVDQLVASSTVKNIMFSLTLFGVCVLVLTVILSIIRNVYKDDSKVTVSSIFGQAIKAVIGFILIPVFCLVGVKFSNVILQAIDGATQAGGQVSSSFTYGIYTACMEDDDSDTNPFKVYGESPEGKNAEFISKQQALMVFCQYLNTKFTEAGWVPNVIEDGNIDTYGELQAFYAHMTTKIFNNFPDILKEDANKNKVRLSLKSWVGGSWFFGVGGIDVYFNQYHAEKNPNGYHYYLPDENGSSVELTAENLEACYKTIWLELFDFYYTDDNGVKQPQTTWTIRKKNSIWNNHNVLNIFQVNEDLNYFNALLASVLIFMALWKLCFGMAKRIVQITVYYILSPIALAMYPWDNGSAFGSWKKDFVGYVIGAYGAIAAMNLTVQLMPIVTGLNIISERPVVNAFAKLVMYIVLAQGMATLVSTLSGWIGAKDLLKEGEETSKKAMAPVAKVAGVALGAAAMAAGVGIAGAKHAIAVHKAGKAGANDRSDSRFFTSDTAKSKQQELADMKNWEHTKTLDEQASLLGLEKQDGETNGAFANRVNAARNAHISQFETENADALAGHILTADEEAEIKQQQKDAAKKQARKDLKGTGGWATAGRAAGKIGASMLGLMGDSSGIDVKKIWTDNMKGVMPDYEKAGKDTGIGITSKAGATATAIANATHAGAVGVALSGAAGAEIARDFGAEADKSAKMLANVWALEMQKLTAVLGKKYDTKEKVELLLSNPAEMAKLSKPKLAALSEYQRNTSSFAKEEVILQNSIDAAIAIESGFAGADEGKLRDLSRKGAADGFKDAKAYLLGEVQKSVEKSGKKWTGDMASEIEKQLDKYFKQNYKPNKD